MKKEPWTIYCWGDKNYYKACCSAIIEGKEYKYGLCVEKNNFRGWKKNPLERLIDCNQNTLKILKNLGKKALTQEGDLTLESTLKLNNRKGKDFPVISITLKQSKE